MLLKSPFEFDISVSLTDGSSISVTKEGSEVPQKFFAEAVNRGAIPLDKDREIETPVAKTKLEDVLRSMIEENNDSDFRDDGYPILERVKAAAGWNVSQEELGEAMRAIEVRVEREALVKEAKALGIKSPHMIKSVDALKERIEKVKAEKAQ